MRKETIDEAIARGLQVTVIPAYQPRETAKRLSTHEKKVRDAIRFVREGNLTAALLAIRD